MANKYTAIQVDSLQVGMIFSTPLYTKGLKLVLPEYYPVFSEIIEELRIERITEVLTEEGLAKEENLQGRIFLPGYISKEIREAIQLYYKSLAILKKQFANPANLQLGELQKVVSPWVDLAVTKKNRNIFLQVIRYTSSSLDKYFYIHSMDTMLLTLAIAFETHTFTPIDLTQIAIGALVCNIGMLRLPDYVKFYDDDMDELMLEQVKKHTELGYRFLMDTLKVPKLFALPALEHHELPDGSGYPYGTRGEDLSANSMIISIADKVSAQIRPRNYRQAKEPAEIVKDFLATLLPVFVGDFQKYVKSALSYLSVYPLTSYLVLESGETCVVVDQSQDPLKPTIQVLLNSHSQRERGTHIIYLVDDIDHNKIAGVYTHDHLQDIDALKITPILSWDIPVSENPNMTMYDDPSPKNNTDRGDSSQQVTIQLGTDNDI